MRLDSDHGIQYVVLITEMPLKTKLWKLKALFGLFFFITQFPSLITLNTTSVWHHHSIFITQYFSHYLWVPYLSLIAGFFFFFLPKLIEPSGKKKRRTNRSKKKKKSQKWSKVVGIVCESFFVCLITILSLNYELWKLKTVKMCFQFP